MTVDLVKVCSCCGASKPATEQFFHPNKGGKYGLRGQCRECRKARVRQLIQQPATKLRRAESSRRYVESGRAASRGRAWRKKNPGSALASKRKWKAANLDAVRSADAAWRFANRDRVRAKQRRADAKLQRNPEHVLKKRIKARVRSMLTRGVSAREFENAIGYTRSDLVRHIERQFTAGMSWSRLMCGEIHIDHIIPASLFRIAALGDEAFRACWALSNLRPLWARDNLAKQARVLTLL